MNLSSITTASYTQFQLGATSRTEAERAANRSLVNADDQLPPASVNRAHGHRTEETRDQPDAARKQPGALTDSEILQQQKVVSELAARDREVRAHEQAHAAVGGVYAGAPQYTFERGPNGKKYAVAGEVSISVSPIEGDPEATILKAEQVRRAALAPAQPSAQDRSVAAQATKMKLEAQAELQQAKSEMNKTGSSDASRTQENQSTTATAKEQSERTDRMSNRLVQGLITEDSLLERTSQSLDVLV